MKTNQFPTIPVLIVGSIVTTFSNAYAKPPSRSDVVAPGLPIRSSGHRKPSYNGNGSVGLIIEDDNENVFALTNFHVAWSMALQQPLKCMVTKSIARGSDDIYIDDRFNTLSSSKRSIGTRTQQLYFPKNQANTGPKRIGMCLRRKRVRRQDAALIQLDPGEHFSNQILGCERLVITGIKKPVPGMLVAKSGRRTGLTFAIVMRSESTKSGYTNWRLQALSAKQLSKEHDFHKQGARSRHSDFSDDSNDCPNEAANCGGDSGSIWFAWPDDPTPNASGLIEVKAIALHHKGNKTYATAADISEILARYNMHVATTSTTLIDTNLGSGRYGGDEKDRKTWCVVPTP